MKEFFKLVASLAIAGVACFASDYRVENLLNGTNANFYIGTADTATAFVSDAYGTNVTYVSATGASPGQTVTPLSTNSSSGAIVPSYARAIPVWTDKFGNVATNIAIQLSAVGNGPFVGPFALRFVRSVDGVNYDTTGGTNSSWNILVDPSNVSNLITNVPSWFLSGVQTIKLLTVATAATVPDGTYLTINRLVIGGWVP